MAEEMLQESTEQFLSGGGEMGKLIRMMDWSKTALGPISSWPQSLRTSVSLCLSSTFPILIAWGEETIQIYNDSYRPICGAKHPESMGQNFRICWETALPVVGDKFTRGQQGEGTYITDQRMFLDRYGYLEEAFMTFSFAPIRDESGGVGGIFHPISESTEKMLSGRRTKVLRDLGAAMGKAKSIIEIGEVTAGQYAAFDLDVPFLLFYQISGEKCQLIEAVGVSADSRLAPLEFEFSDSPFPIAELQQGAEMMELQGLSGKFAEFSCGPYEEAPDSAVVLPVRISGQHAMFGFVVAGVSARRALDNDYFNFYGQLAATYNIAVSSVYAYEQEQKRAEALAEIDRSKTAFFSNVSHEFRTPLTLMLGPLEELLSREGFSGSDRAHVEASHRNALRLLKLVNNLLDYSRVEAGRVQAAYRPVDIAELTEDLASSFRSIIEKAGMELEVDCRQLSGRYYLDQQMWEKIVLNLLSNAFKYTLEGKISVSLSHEGGFAVLRVADTGVGIPEKELPHMFERFHRVENTAGRTHEGTGIGLSLVHELVQLHGGEISVNSVEEQGSVFTVRIPEGNSHLPNELVFESGIEPLSSSVKGAFIKEAASLLEENSDAEHNDLTEHRKLVSDQDVQILVVDDNADMRAYLKRILEPYYTVRTAINGRDALAQVAVLIPDLILSDVMMPVMDGKQMLSELRTGKATYRLPVIFLSARAGEEARIDGLESGADDYLVKPFSSAELLTKIRAQINIGRTRNFAEQQLRQLLVQAPVAMATYRGPEHVIELANERMLAYWGRKENQVVGLPALLAIPELGFQGFIEIMNKVYETGETFVSGEIGVEFEREGVLEMVYVNLMVEPLRKENGEIDGLIAVAADVTEQVGSRRELEHTSSQLGIAIEAANMGVWRSELATGKLELSARARAMHGIPLTMDISFSQALTRLVDPAHIARVSAAIDGAVAGSGRFNIDYTILPMDGSEPKWMNTTGMVELDGNGKPLSVVGTLLDITEGKEDELRKNDFIGMVSHELKTPLTSLNGFTQLGSRRAEKLGAGELKSLFEKSISQVGKMSAMINGFLNISQLESGKFVLNVGSFSIKDLISETVDDIHLVSPDQEFKLECEDVQLAADRDKVSTVLTNLLGNAVKYGKKIGPISVSCTTADGIVKVMVRDQGPGIGSAEIARLFDRFYRVENAQTQHISGFGIGLYLSAEIIRRHGGRIWAESELGKGASFFFELPLEQEKG
ncbi:MAG: ATP-binding protein [Bacteroidota bacterium]